MASSAHPRLRRANGSTFLAVPGAHQDGRQFLLYRLGFQLDSPFRNNAIKFYGNTIEAWTAQAHFSPPQMA
jgi:hypothetical protein